MRKRVLERARLGGFGVAADVWFATITRKIDAMKGLEDQLADGIHQQVLSLRQAARWKQQFGFDGTVAVNMPYRMFLQKDMVELVESSIAPRQLPHHRRRPRVRRAPPRADRRR